MVQSAKTIYPPQHSDYSIRDDQPVLLKEMASAWPALKLWTPEYFLNHFGERMVALSQYSKLPNQRSRDKVRTTLASYLKVILNQSPETSDVHLGSYVAGWHFQKNAEELNSDFEIPEPFRENLLDRINKEIINYDSTSLFIGHSHVETPLHTDSFGVCVWLANVVGRKIIRVIPPVDYKNIYNGLDAFDEKNVHALAELGIPVIEATIDAGDIFVIPPGYWHQVKNVGFTVAISTNFMSSYHFLTYEQQLKAKVLAPYLRLLKLKREIVSTEKLDHSKDCLRHLNFVENEERFLNFLSEQLVREREILLLAKQHLAQNA